MKRFFRNLFIQLSLTGLCTASLAAHASSAEKQKAFLDVKYINEDGAGRVHFKLYTLHEGKKEPVRFSVVNLFLSEESKWGMMGNITSDSSGEGAVPLHDRFAVSSKNMSEYLFIGSMKDDPRLMEIQTKVIIKPARLELTLYQQDSTKYAKAILNEKDTAGNWIAVPGVKIDFYVEQYYCMLPSSTTDENGEALLEIPGSLKGDKTGTTKIVAKINESSRYGTLLASAHEKWGVPDATEGLIDKLLSITIIIGIWGFILYLIWYLLKKGTGL